MKSNHLDKHVKAIDAIERGNKLKGLGLVMIIVLIVGSIILFRPELPEQISDNVVSSVKNLSSRIMPEEEVVEEVAEEENETIEEVVEEKPGTVLVIGAVNEFRAKTVILTYVNSKQTYCMIRVNDESVLITAGNKRAVQGINIEVLEPMITPKESCRVVMR
jgi:hypothetical protein